MDSKSWLKLNLSLGFVLNFIASLFSEKSDFYFTLATVCLVGLIVNRLRELDQ